MIISVVLPIPKSPFSCHEPAYLSNAAYSLRFVASRYLALVDAGWRYSRHHRADSVLAIECQPVDAGADEKVGSERAGGAKELEDVVLAVANMYQPIRGAEQTGGCFQATHQSLHHLIVSAATGPFLYGRDVAER